MLIIEYNKNPKTFDLPAALGLAPEKRKARKLMGLIELNRGQIVNTRPHLRRNRKVSIGGVVAKFKRFPANRFPIPHETIDNRTARTRATQEGYAK